MAHHQLPFYSQSWNLEKWKEAGFESREDAEYWQNSSCGILCLGMVLQKVKQKPVSISELITKGKKIGAYNHTHGWSHDGLVNLAEKYGLEAKRYERLSLDDLKNFLDRGYVIVVSIKWAFKKQKNLKERIMFWKKFGGHLALVVGYDSDSGDFIVHHTSIHPEFNWEHKYISRDVFRKSFTGRGIILKVK